MRVIMIRPLSATDVLAAFAVQDLTVGMMVLLGILEILGVLVAAR
jgi:hypothetical protein